MKCSVFSVLYLRIMCYETQKLIKKLRFSWALYFCNTFISLIIWSYFASKILSCKHELCREEVFRNNYILLYSQGCFWGGMAGTPGPWCMKWFFWAHSLWWDTSLSLNTGGGAWFYLRLAFQTLLTLQKRPYPLWGVDGRWKGGS